MKILIVGTGYVGLVTAACLAEMGHSVLCLDIDKQKIALLEEGILPFYEPGLKELIERNGSAGRLSFTTSYKQGVAHAAICLLALPTPSLPDGSCDLSYLKSAIDSIVPYLDHEMLIVNKSTAPPGTTQLLEEWLSSPLVEVISNPEFLKEGSAVADCLKPDRIIIGTHSERGAQAMKELYAPFMLNKERILIMDPASAELSKYASNAMLALRISFMNEMAAICERVGANIKEVRKGVGSDTRIGPHFLYAGAGFGGSCFPKDIKALLHLSQEIQTPSLLMEAIETINNKQKKVLFHKLSSFFKEQGGLSGKRIGIWGLSFKPDTDDMREATSLTLISCLLDAGAIIQAYDPIAMPNAKKMLPPHPQLLFVANEQQAAAQADALVLVTEWKQFRSVDFSSILSLMKQPVFFDGRNQYDPVEMRKWGFYYSGIGTPSQQHALSSIS